MQKLPIFAVLVGLILAQPVAADVPSVVSDIPPVHALVAQVMGDLGTPGLIIRPGASPHSYALRPSEARSLQQADLVIWTGEALTPWLEKPLQSLAADALTIELLALPQTKHLSQRQDARFEPHDHDHGGAHEDSHDDHGEEENHDENTEHENTEHENTEHMMFDPHAWLDPDNGQIWLGAIAGALADLDPENASIYKANAETAMADLDQLTAEITTVLASFQGAGFVVFHDAYQYFETRFSVLAQGALSLSDASDPGPARLAEVRALLSDQNIACVFAEPQANTRLLQTVLQGTPARLVVIDPMGVEFPLGPNLYGDVLRQMATDMATCAP